MTQERISAVIDALAMPVLLIGPDERVRSANAPLEAILGPDLIEKHYITALRQPAVVDAIERPSDTGM